MGRRTPAAKEKQRQASARYRARPEWLAQRRAYKNSPKYKEKRRDDFLKKKFGINLEIYNEMLLAQNGVCAICLKHTEKDKRNLAVDHCHKTGKIRGLLCRFCNQALGQLGDDVGRIKRMIIYLQR